MKNHKKDFIIGIDSGGSRLRMKILFTNSDRIICKDTKSTHLNTSGINIFCKCLEGRIKSFINNNRLSLINCMGIGIAIAGARSVKIKNAIQNNLKKLLNIQNVLITSDIEALIYSVFGKNDGAVIISGTGSVIYAQFKNKLIRYGGWGRIIGDVGSGFEIGKVVLQNLTSEYDFRNGKPKSKYLKLIENKFKLNSDNLVEKIYLKKFNIASIAGYIVKLADSGEKECKKILEMQANKLVKQLEDFIKSKKIRAKLNLILAGGLLENKNFYSKLIKQQIKSKFKNKFSLIDKKFSTVDGAIKLAFKKFLK